MKIKTPYAQLDLPCRTGQFGQVHTLTLQFIQTRCATCQARIERRFCVRNLTRIESKLGLTKTCYCGRPVTHDAPHGICTLCEIERLTTIIEQRRPLCAEFGCENHATPHHSLCQKHHWAKRGMRPPCTKRGCHQQRAVGSALCDQHLEERIAQKIARDNQQHPWRFEIFEPAYVYV